MLDITTSIGTRGRALIALFLVVALGLIAPAPAHAGTYRAALCNPELAAFHAGAAFERNSRRFRPRTSCGAGGDGLVVTRATGRARRGAWGAWVIRAPRGTAITGLAVNAASRARAGNVPELLAGDAPDEGSFASPAGEPRRFRWSGVPARAFAARLRCARRGGCHRGHRSRIRIKRLTLVLHDASNPTLGLNGSLLAAGSRRGLQRVAPVAADAGGGVRRFLLQVNGAPLSSHTVRCHLVRRIAVRLAPCPTRAGAGFAAITTSPPFRQGPNLVRVCATDYALSTAANRSCAAHRVRIDNLCPLSYVGGAATLRARVRRDPNGATVAGRLTDARGHGVSGAQVCVATRVRLAGIAERVAATPLTGAHGRFAASLAQGPSREVRIAYWPGPTAALERYLRLDVPARPRLRLRPRHPIQNGHRLRFEVRLPGPRSQRRRVMVQARAGHHWLQLRGGLTGAGGVYRARYRFRATTGHRRYAFRAVVPKQPGYPYERGRSKVRHATVIG